jgi:hypothetical protein
MGTLSGGAATSGGARGSDLSAEAVSLPAGACPAGAPQPAATVRGARRAGDAQRLPPPQRRRADVSRALTTFCPHPPRGPVRVRSRSRSRRARPRRARRRRRWRWARRARPAAARCAHAQRRRAPLGAHRQAPTAGAGARVSSRFVSPFVCCAFSPLALPAAPPGAALLQPGAPVRGARPRPACARAREGRESGRMHALRGAAQRRADDCGGSFRRRRPQPLCRFLARTPRHAPRHAPHTHTQPRTRARAHPHAHARAHACHSQRLARCFFFSVVVPSPLVPVCALCRC